jgi:hypothetical protein
MQTTLKTPRELVDVSNLIFLLQDCLRRNKPLESFPTIFCGGWKWHMICYQLWRIWQGTHWSHEGNELIEPFFPGSASTVQMNHCLHCMKSFSSTADWN